MDSEMNTVSSFSVMPTIYRGPLMQAPTTAIFNTFTLRGSTSIMITLVHASSFMCFFDWEFTVLNWIFKFSFNRTIAALKKIHLRLLLDIKIQISTNLLLPLSFWYAFSLFSLIFNYFLIFLDFQQAWINFMVPNDGIHIINSCKINLGLVRAQHLWYFLQYRF